MVTVCGNRPPLMITQYKWFSFISRRRSFEDDLEDPEEIQMNPVFGSSPERELLLSNFEPQLDKRFQGLLI